MSRNAWLTFAVLVIAVIAGLVVISQQDKIDVSSVDVSRVQEASDASGNISDQVFGKKDSPVVLIEYGDFQCPGCSTSASVMKELSEKYEDKIAFVFRNYPLVSAHPNAMISASSAEAAGLQGKYWEMHDRIFVDQGLWKNLSGSARLDYFIGVAEELSLDIDKFKSDLESDAVSKKIRFDRSLGDKSQISGTPAFFLNNKSISDLWYKDDKIVAARTEGAAQVWTSVDAMEKFVILPALEEHNIK